jgi:hypothetical protein
MKREGGEKRKCADGLIKANQSDNFMSRIGHWKLGIGN